MRGLLSWNHRTPHRFSAGYLVVALIPLILTKPTGWSVAWLVGHLAALVWFANVGRSTPESARPPRSRWSFAADWAPLLLIPFAYAELPQLNQVFSNVYYDAWILGFEQSAFGADPSADWAGAFPVPWFSELVHLSYLSYFPLIYVPPLAYYLRGDRRAFFTASAAVMLTFFACLVVFVFLPVQGPRYLRPAPVGIPSGPIRSMVLWVLEGGSSRGAAFPSSHVAVAVAQVAVMARFYPRSSAPLALLTLGLALGAVYGGFHYATDAVVGAVVGLVVAAWVPTIRVRDAPGVVDAERAGP
jgi:membrane-associated phospholipid phosphatase